MQTIDLYTQHYLGELQIILQEKSNNQILFKVILLDYHFNEILNLIPNGNYHPESLINNFYKCTGYYDDEWECKRKQEFLDQLNAININNISSDFVDAYNAIKQICLSAINNNNNNKLYIELL
ncbi:hypothetical protein SY27_05100 [Flavobacterium sp. 316]|uniref:hypothetical protein n=1 Tax=Flavobacterium sp. 316 TaxID=1603293 RepID=UPI0005E00AA7|nr:hypothetical protein [Flavobacterium sp. 316]KIX22048.1 hypothetical protein SY27_05100 [Flavobacterium sp. 316]